MVRSGELGSRPYARPVDEGMPAKVALLCVKGLSVCRHRLAYKQSVD
jgi:hypothetical protein